MTMNYEISKRNLITAAIAGLSLSVLLNGGKTMADEKPKILNGKIGEFDFLTGSWKIKNQQLKKGSKDEWEYFDGEATVVSILNGLISIEELLIPSKNFYGMGLRALNLETLQWADHWVNAKSGIVGEPMLGNFINGEGIFIVDDMQGDIPVKYISAWDEITKNSCRWYQGTSYDGGKTWEKSWIMQWKRSKKAK